ncbi:hypothetical protein HS7_04000 [Sulfolobales archaeon HS-7]|nr:hypothetical protein HS7_04000 [Sulfolobales archaeon HS-7]
MTVNNSFIDGIIFSMAEDIREGEVVYVGLNSIIPLLAAAMARDFLKKDIVIVGVAEALNPLIEVTPSSGDPRLTESSPILPTIEAFDLVQKGKVDVMFLRPAQIDNDGNLNLTVIGNYAKPKVKLPGGAATAFISPLIKRLFLWTTNEQKTLVQRVDFITGTVRNSNNEVRVYTESRVLCFERPGWRQISSISSPSPAVTNFLDSIDPQGLRYAF